MDDAKVVIGWLSVGLGGIFTTATMLSVFIIALNGGILGDPWGRIAYSVMAIGFPEGFPIPMILLGVGGFCMVKPK